MSDRATAILACAFVSFVFGVSASSAQQKSYEQQQAEDDARLFACFDAAPPEDRRARLACIGVVFDDCQSRPSLSGGNYTVGCFLAEATAWENLMHREFVATLDYSGGLEVLTDAKSPAEMLSASQSAWQAFVFAHCGYANAKWGSGSMRLIDGALCYRDMYAARTIFLWQERQPMPWPEDLGWHQR